MIAAALGTESSSHDGRGEIHAPTLGLGPLPSRGASVHDRVLDVVAKKPGIDAAALSRLVPGASSIARQLVTKKRLRVVDEKFYLPSDAPARPPSTSAPEVVGPPPPLRHRRQKR